MAPCNSVGPRRGEPVWSPDGRELAVASKAGIYVMKADGTGLRPISPDRQSILLALPIHDESIFSNTLPAWQPIPTRRSDR